MASLRQVTASNYSLLRWLRGHIVKNFLLKYITHHGRQYQFLRSQIILFSCGTLANEKFRIHRWDVELLGVAVCWYFFFDTQQGDWLLLKNHIRDPMTLADEKLASSQLPRTQHLLSAVSFLALSDLSPRRVASHMSLNDLNRREVSSRLSRTRCLILSCRLLINFLLF